VNFHSSKTINSAINFRYLLLIFPLIVVLSGCDSIVFENKIDTILDPVDHVKYLNVSAASISDSTWTKTPKRDKAVRLFIGKFEDYKAAALLRFEFLDTLVDTSNIKSLILELTITNTIGEQSGDSMLVSLYKNSEEWNEDDLSERVLNDFTSMLGDPVSATTVLWNSVDSAFSFNIPNYLVQNWRDNNDTTGFIIVGDSSSNFIISSPSRKSGIGSSLPNLQVIFKDTTDTLSVLPSHDGYLLSINTEMTLSDPERTYIGGGEAYRGFFNFTSELLDSILETSKISRAELNIGYDSLRSILPNKNSSATGLGFTLYFSYIDPSSESDSLFITAAGDSTPVSIPIDGNIISFNITNILQRWVAENLKERGLVIWSGSEGSQLFRVALYRCDVVTDPSGCVGPELNVYYMTSEAIED